MLMPTPQCVPRSAGQPIPSLTQRQEGELVENVSPVSQTAGLENGSQKPPEAQSLVAVQSAWDATSGMQMPFAQRELLSQGTVALHAEAAPLVPSAVQIETPPLVAQ